ncbi:MAG: hypothetical protein AAF431_19645 [Pseudomonadota bacterium]
MVSNDNQSNISDLDIWRAAHMQIKRYGNDASSHAVTRADELLEAGDHEGSFVWKRIYHAIEEMQREQPKDGEAVH